MWFEECKRTMPSGAGVFLTPDDNVLTREDALKRVYTYQYDANSRMIKEMFNFRDYGRGSAIAVILLIAIIPVMVTNIRRFREQEATR